MSLQDWLAEGRLKSHTTSNSELRQIFAVYQRDMTDAQMEELSDDRRFATAYNAALMIARAALAASGYQTDGAGNHYWTIQSLTFTLKLDTRTINKFNKFRQKRNIADYEMIGMVSERDVTEVLALAQELKSSLTEWLEIYHPGLLERRWE